MVFIVRVRCFVIFFLFCFLFFSCDEYLEYVGWLRHGLRRRNLV